MKNHPRPTSARGRAAARDNAKAARQAKAAARDAKLTAKLDAAREQQIRQDRQIIEARSAARRGTNGQRPPGGGKR